MRRLLQLYPSHKNLRSGSDGGFRSFDKNPAYFIVIDLTFNAVKLIEKYCSFILSTHFHATLLWLKRRA